MAEIRKHNPDAGDDLARLVREALGETIRPVEPGPAAAPPGPDSADEPDPTSFSAADVPTWDPDGPMLQF